MGRAYKQGRVRVTKAENGYALDEGIVIYRSSYEHKAINIITRLYKAGRIQSWRYETDVFQYVYDVDGKEHRYFMDYTVTMVDGTVVFIEVKPWSETQPPRKGRNQKPETFERAMLTYIKNMNKWDAVTKWCDHENSKLGYIKYKFAKWTEIELGIGKIKRTANQVIRSKQKKK